MRNQLRPCRRLAAGLGLALAACGQGRNGDGTAETARFSERLRADRTTRDVALAELRTRKGAGLATVGALLDDPAVATTPGQAELREELVYMLGEAGATSTEVQLRLVRLLREPDSDVGVALAAARGLVLSWGLCRDVALLEGYLALLARVSRPDDARKARAVSQRALACPFPYEPGFVAALRAGAERPRSCAFCVAALRRYAGHEAEFTALFRRIAARLETDPPRDDPAEEAERLALREVVAHAIAETDGR